MQPISGCAANDHRIPERDSGTPGRAIDCEGSAEFPSASGAEQLPVPFGHDLSGAVDHFYGRLIVNCIGRYR
jgi:hypothetical protein